MKQMTYTAQSMEKATSCAMMSGTCFEGQDSKNVPKANLAFLLIALGSFCNSNDDALTRSILFVLLSIRDETRHSSASLWV